MLISKSVSLVGWFSSLPLLFLYFVLLSASVTLLKLLITGHYSITGHNITPIRAVPWQWCLWVACKMTMVPASFTDDTWGKRCWKIWKVNCIVIQLESPWRWMLPGFQQYQTLQRTCPINISASESPRPVSGVFLRVRSDNCEDSFSICE